MWVYIAYSPLEKVSSEELIDIFKNLMERCEIQPKLAVKIFVSGSFLNEEQL